MGPFQRKIKAGYRFRAARPFQKSGLYFEYILDHPKDGYRINDKDVVEIRDFLSRYINYHIKQIDTELTKDIRAKARAIERAANKIESK